MGHNFPPNPLVATVSALLSIMGDHAYIGESNEKDRNIIDGQGNFNFVCGSPESLAGDMTVGSGICFPRTFTGGMQLPLSVMKCILKLIGKNMFVTIILS